MHTAVGCQREREQDRERVCDSVCVCVCVCERERERERERESARACECVCVRVYPPAGVTITGGSFTATTVMLSLRPQESSAPKPSPYVCTYI
jgi:hypothetical protein